MLLYRISTILYPQPSLLSRQSLMCYLPIGKEKEQATARPYFGDLRAGSHLRGALLPWHGASAPFLMVEQIASFTESPAG